MSRYARRTDDNHAAVVDALRKAGAVVRSLAKVGDGCPDLLVGYRGRTLLLEVKDGSKPPSARRLTADEERFFDEWTGGPLAIVESPELAVDVLTGVRPSDR